MAGGAAELKAIGTLDNSNFKRNAKGMTTSAKQTADEVSKSGNKMANAFKGLAIQAAAVFAFRAGARFIFDQMQAADRTMDLANNLGIEAEQLQALEASAEQYGGTLQDVQKSVMQLRRMQGEALTGQQQYIDSFKTLGVSIRDLQTLSLPELLAKVSQGYVKAGASAEAYSAASDLLGRGGKELTGVLNDLGNTTLPNFVDKYKKLGAVLDNEVTAKLADANNVLQQFGRQVSNVAIIELASLVEKLGQVGKGLVDVSWKAHLLIRHPELSGYDPTTGATPEQKAAAKAAKKAAEEKAAADKIAADKATADEARHLAARKAYAKGEAREQAADDKLWREAEEEANEKAWAKEEAWAKAIWASEAAAKEKIAEKLAASDELRIVSGAGKQAAKDAAARQIADITVSSPQAADRLARIGGIIGAQTSPQQGAMERMAKETEIQTRLAEEIKDIVASMDAKLVALEE